MDKNIAKYDIGHKEKEKKLQQQNLEACKIIKEQMNQSMKKSRIEQDLVKEAREQMNKIVKENKQKEFEKYLVQKQKCLDLYKENQ
jgi:hypothetical protein